VGNRQEARPHPRSPSRPPPPRYLRRGLRRLREPLLGWPPLRRRSLEIRVPRRRTPDVPRRRWLPERRGQRRERVLRAAPAPETDSPPGSQRRVARGQPQPPDAGWPVDSLNRPGLRPSQPVPSPAPSPLEQRAAPPHDKLPRAPSSPAIAFLGSGSATEFVGGVVGLPYGSG